MPAGAVGGGGFAVRQKAVVEERLRPPIEIPSSPELEASGVALRTDIDPHAASTLLTDPTLFCNSSIYLLFVRQKAIHSGGSYAMDRSFFEESREQSIIKARIIAKYFWAWAKVIIPTAKQHDNRIAYIDL